MNALPPYYAFATNTADGCGGTPSQRTFGGVTGNFGESCDALKQRVLGKVTPQRLGPPTPSNLTTPPKGHQKIPHTPTPINPTGTTSIPGGGTVFAPAADFQIPGLDDISNSINSVIDSAGIPREFMGIPTWMMIGGSAAVLLLLLVLKR